MDDLSSDRIEIDTIRFSGPCFSGVDNRLMVLQLVEQGFTDAAMFTADGEVVQPAEVLYGKPILIERGSFRPVTHATVDILESATARFLTAVRDRSVRPVVVMEMSLRNLMSSEIMDHADFLTRVDLLGVLGKSVMISRYAPYYPLAEYLRRYSHEQIVFALGIPNLQEIFEERYYTELGGGIVEALGRLFRAGVKLYVYPSKDPVSGSVVTAESLVVAPHIRSLYSYFLENGLIESIPSADLKQLDIHAGEVLSRIRRGDDSWEGMVPEESARMIKDRKCFGYRTSRDPSTDRHRR
jgi:hypothetical protein